MEGDKNVRNCKFANPPLNVCQGRDENGSGCRTEHCSDNNLECERYRTFNRILENLDRKNPQPQARYARISTVG